MNPVIVYMTCAGADEARLIVSELLERHLIACANIIGPALSLYRWQGRIEEAQEVTVIMKTQAGLFEKMRETACLLHSYECPCIVAWPLTGGHAPFLSWINDETTDGAQK